MFFTASLGFCQSSNNPKLTTPKQSQETITKYDSVFSSLQPTSDVLIIAFGGVGEQFGIPRYEFMKILSNFNVNVLFVRDIQHAYYQYGIETGGNISKTFRIIEDEIDKIQPRKISIFGNSAGGYAALLFGFLLSSKNYPISEVHAFAPIFSTKKVINRKYRTYFNIEPEYFSLEKVFSHSSPPCTNFNIYYALDGEADVKFASQLVQFSWIKHHVYDEGGHRLVRKLRDNGKLYSIIEESILDIP